MEAFLLGVITGVAVWLIFSFIIRVYYFIMDRW